jgi:serine phosphatase RsbU (regulator of sigma subunit)
MALDASGTRSPFGQALFNLLRTLSLYTVLLFLGAVLVRVTTGLDLFKASEALLTYVIGLMVTSVFSGLHLAESLVEAERARSRAELETLNLRLLEADRLRKTRELEEARELQVSMLAKDPPAWEGIRFAHRLETATEVGGDLYDHRRMPDGSLLLAFGDATGHGLQAGLLVTAAKALFHALPPGPLPRSLEILGQGIRGLQMPRMAMALTLLALEGDTLRIAIAGMPPLFHYRKEDRAVASCRASGPPLGQLSRFDYAETRLPLAPGDRILLCSDGFPECMDLGDRMLGYGRIGDLFLAQCPQAAEGILQALADEARRWAGGRPLADDLSLLVLARD